MMNWVLDDINARERERELEQEIERARRDVMSPARPIRTKEDIRMTREYRSANYEYPGPKIQIEIVTEPEPVYEEMTLTELAGYLLDEIKESDRLQGLDYDDELDPERVEWYARIQACIDRMKPYYKEVQKQLDKETSNVA